MHQIVKEKNIVQKLVQRPLALFSISIISITMLVAILAYQLAPDNSPNANQMILELTAKPPGFSKDFLVIPKSENQLTQSSSWWSGTPSKYSYIPINNYAVMNKQLLVSHYIDEGISDNLTYDLKELCPQSITSAENQIKFIENHAIQTKTFWLGTDRYGRDVLSRLIIGARVSIAVGVIAVMLSITLGVTLGAIAGYFGGMVDHIVMFFINILWSIPTMFLVFAITIALGKGFWEIFIAIGLTMWVGTARVVRGEVKSLRERDFVIAAKAIGLSDFKIIYKHILPNVMGSIIVLGASNFATAILVEAGLSFLGIGIQAPQPSWGLMIKEHYNFIITNQPMIALIPGFAIMLLVYAFNILGNTLRDINDERDS
jgi:ABC-type dipeptide/oligopeptide/nickel transport system permease subunit